MIHLCLIGLNIYDIIYISILCIQYLQYTYISCIINVRALFFEESGPQTVSKFKLRNLWESLDTWFLGVCSAHHKGGSEPHICKVTVIDLFSKLH